MENLVPTLETIKGDGGSIKVGTTGTISALMSRELISTKSSAQTPISSRNKSSTVFISPMVSKRPTRRTSPVEASSSNNNKKSSENVGKNKHNNQNPHQIPTLDSDNISLDGTPSRYKPDKSGSYIVEIVDFKCGNPDRPWAPITNRLKKLSFSKLSENSDLVLGSGNRI